MTLRSSGTSADTCVHKGLQTGSVEASADDSSSVLPLFSAIYYDSLCQVSQIVSTNHLGGTVVTDNEYTYRGAIARQSITTTIPLTNGTDFSIHEEIANTYDFEHSDKLHSSIIRLDIAGGNTVLLDSVNLSYDTLGRLVGKARNGSDAGLTYTYDKIHGWLTDISSAGGFSQHLYRETGSSSPRHDGAISAKEWHVPGELYDRKYAYSYDSLNRLAEATYSQSARVETAAGDSTSKVTDAVLAEATPNATGLSKTATVTSSGLSLIPTTDLELTLSEVSATETQTTITTSSVSSNASSLVLAQNHYGEKISYDRNSNILTLQRRGMLDTKKYGLIDDLEISYNGNQRTAITDNAGSLSYDNASDFADGADETEEYNYDANGALTKDLNRGIDSIEYDLLGNPKRISFSNDKSIEYVYSADGVKLRETHISPMLMLGSTSRAITTVDKQAFYKKEVIDYIGNLILKNGHLESLQFDGGYVSFDSDTISGIHYYIQDYMGNVRAVVNRDAKLGDKPEQVTHYYPYGGVIGDISTNESFQRHKFEGKELDRSFGLDNYDIQARNYFAMAPMWDRVDPLSEKYYGISPYVYCGGDPVNLGDYDGMDIWTIDETGRVLNREMNAEFDQFVVDHGSNNISKSKEYCKGTILFETHSEKGLNCQLKINNSDDAGDLHDFFMTNTDVEWRTLETNEPGRTGSTYLTTSNSVSSEGTGSELLSFLGEGVDVLNSDHNHPSGSPIPSGTYDSPSKGGKGTFGDILEARTNEGKGMRPNYYIESIIPGTNIIRTTQYDSSGNWKIIRFRMSNYPIKKEIKGVQYP